MLGGDTLSERYEQTLARIEQIKQAGCHVKIQWECKFDEAKIVEQKPELLVHPNVKHAPLVTRDALYGVEPRPCISIIRYVSGRNLSSIVM
jgi:hypothetical protein